MNTLSAMFNPIDEEDWPEDECDGILLSDTRGVYIPRDFCESFEQLNCDNDDWECCLKGPYWEETITKPGLSFADRLFNSWKEYLETGEWDWECESNVIHRIVYNEWYWEAWNFIEQNWSYEEETDYGKFRYYLHQDGDLFLMKETLEINKQTRSNWDY